MICVSISKVSYEQALEYAGKYPFVEFRMETLPVSVKEAGNLFSIAERSIATCRITPRQEGRRKMLLRRGLEYGADFVDLDIETDAHLFAEIGETARSAGAKLIISYHNFKETPINADLENICEKAFQHGADIVKIACAVHRPEDNIRLLSLCAVYPSILPIGMGPMGRLTRLVGPFFGTPFTFAHPDDQPATAPGQIPYSRLKNLQEEIEELIRVNA